MNERILYNAIKTPDGTILHSKYGHDFVQYTDKNGQYYANDGGNDYCRRVFDKPDYEDLTVYDDGKHSTRREYLVWGKNYDKDMNRLPKTEYVFIKDLTTDHIEAILKTQTRISDFYKEVFNDEMKLRKENV